MTTMPMDLKNFNLTCETDIPVRLSFDQVLQLYHFHKVSKKGDDIHDDRWLVTNSRKTHDPKDGKIFGYVGNNMIHKFKKRQLLVTDEPYFSYQIYIQSPLHLLTLKRERIQIKMQQHFLVPLNKEETE
jgi:hypothetical protein